MDVSSIDDAVPVDTEYYILRPCKFDRAFKLVPKLRGYSMMAVVDKLRVKLNCTILVETKHLTVVKLQDALVTIHANGEMVIREIIDEEEVKRLASNIVEAIRGV